MTPQQIVALGIRILAIFLAAYGLEYVFSVPASMNAANKTDLLHIAYSIGVPILIVAALLWFFPMAIAHRILPRTRFENHLKLQPLEAARVGCALIGLWLFTKVALSVPWSLLVAIATEGQSIFRSLDSIDFVFDAAETALALILILKSDVFAKIALRDNDSRGDGEDSRSDD